MDNIGCHEGTGMTGGRSSGSSGGSSSSSSTISSAAAAAQTELELDDIDQRELRRGPWTSEEDHILINYISLHGEGRWNSLARCAGLKRTGKSCRLRWLNYLRPDVRRGNITIGEQLLILELHSRWGSRWSKIAQELPGRTDNEIKNYWRTRVQKHAKQLKCDVDSKQFKDAMRYLWIPRLMEQASLASSSSSSADATGPPSIPAHDYPTPANCGVSAAFGAALIGAGAQVNPLLPQSSSYPNPNNNCGTAPDSFGSQVVFPACWELAEVINNPSPDNYNLQYCSCPINDQLQDSQIDSYNYHNLNQGLSLQGVEQNNQQWLQAGDAATGSSWSVEDIWFLQQQLNSSNNGM